MSRFLGKNAVPISIMKEKENKAATATRSATCSIGKWGNVCFTSTRYSSLQTSIIAQTNEDIKNETSFDRDRSVSPPAEPVKPKKFFKSRNNTQARVIIIPAPSDVSSSTLETSPNSSAAITTNKNKKNTNTQNYLHISERNENKRSEEVGVKQRVNSSNSAVSSRKVKKEREKHHKEPKEKEQIVEQPPTPGTRSSTRNKKIVNYNLEEDSIFCRSRETEKDKKEISSSTSTNEATVPPASNPAPPPPQNESNVDHPPIVLRISKVSLYSLLCFFVETSSESFFKQFCDEVAFVWF